MRVLHRVESGICGDDTASIDMPLPNRDGVTGVDIDVGIRVGWQIPKKKGLALPVRAIYVPGGWCAWRDSNPQPLGPKPLGRHVVQCCQIRM